MTFINFQQALRACFFLLLISIVLGCKPDPNELITISGKTMGTTYTVKYYPDIESPIKSEELHKLVEEKLKHVNQLMSTYIPTSEISMLNSSQSKEGHPISLELAVVLSYALELSHKAHNLFDPTVGPLVNIWGFGPLGPQKVPTNKQIKETLKYVGADKIEIKKLENQIRAFKKHKKTYVDLSATAKGYAVDQLSSILLSRGFKNHLVDIGGEIKSNGKKPNGPWTIAIETPNTQERSIHKTIALNNICIATSGNYRNYFKHGETIYAHTINPKTGYPTKHNLVSVSVLHKSCMAADSLATALMAMGPEKAFKYAKNQQLKAYMILSNKDNLDVKTTGFFNIYLKNNPL